MARAAKQYQCRSVLTNLGLFCLTCPLSVIGVFVLLTMFAVFVFFYVDLNHLAQVALDRTIMRLAPRFDPLEIGAARHDFKYKLYFEIKLGSIEWRKGNLIGLRLLRRVTNVRVSRADLTIAANITLGCIDLLAQTVMNPRLGSFRSTVDVPVNISIGYVQVNFQLKQNISLTDSPRVEHLQVQKFESIQVFYEMRLVGGLLRVLTRQIVWYYHVRIKKMLAALLQEKINQQLSNYTLARLFNPFTWWAQ